MSEFHFKNPNRMTIGSNDPNTVLSTVNVSGVPNVIEGVRVKINIAHTYTSDLNISIINPEGVRVSLVANAGASGDNFDETSFDDNAAQNIENAQAPFRGSFKPNEQLSVFNNTEANGEWTLEIIDQAFQDGGVLLDWELTIVSEDDTKLPLVFNNMTPQTISPGAPNSITSKIEISEQGALTIESLVVVIDINHTYANDLQVSLRHSDGTEVNLVSFVGGSGDNFQTTTFDDNGTQSIQSGSPPFNDTFKPIESLVSFKDKAINGVWTLLIFDSANLDGGTLNFWKMCVVTNEAPVSPISPFSIDVRFVGGLTQSQQDIFAVAARRWSEVIQGDLPSFQVDGEVIDDLLILAEGKVIDGESGILGQAGPTHVRPDTRLPIKGIMSFDSADLQSLEDSGELLDVIIHEMGHVIGIGTIWRELGLIQNSGSDNPIFLGLVAMREYGTLLGSNSRVAVPIANTGGPGTREGHWRELVFDSELMTGFDDPGRNALSRLTVASLQDLGYQVNLNAADSYSLPLQQISLESLQSKSNHRCNINFPDIQVVSETSRIS